MSYGDVKKMILSLAEKEAKEKGLIVPAFLRKKGYVRLAWSPTLKRVVFK